MGKEGKMENQSGLNLVIIARDGVKKIDELEISSTNLFVRCLAFEAMKASVTTSTKDLSKERKNFITVKKFLEKYAR